MKYNRKQRSSNPIDILKFETVETGAVFKQYDVNTSILEIALVANGEPVRIDNSFKIYATVKPRQRSAYDVLYRYSEDYEENETSNYKILLNAEKMKVRSLNNMINLYLSPLALSFSGDMVAELILVDLENQQRVTSQEFTFKIEPSLTPNQEEDISYTVIEDLGGTYITDSEELKLLAIDGVSGFKLSFTGLEVNEILQSVQGLNYEENNEALESLNQKDEEIQESIKAATKEREKINSEIILLKNKDSELDTKIEQLNLYNSTNDLNINEIKSDLSKLEEYNSSNDIKIQTIDREIESLKEYDETNTSSINEIKEDIVNLKSYNSSNDESIRNINSNIENFKQYNSNNTEVVNGIKSDLQSYKSSNNQAVSDVRENLESYKTSNNQSVNSINENLENFKNTANQTINDINVDISSLKDYNTTNDSKIEEINRNIERNTNSISENLQKINSNTSLIEVNKKSISSINLKNEEIERDLTSSKENIENNKNDILNLNKKVNKNIEDIKLLKEGSIGGSSSNSNKEVIDARTATTGEIFDTLDERIDCEVDRLNKKIDVTMLQQEDKESHVVENTVDGMTTDMVIKGRTSQNLCKKSTKISVSSNTVAYSLDSLFDLRGKELTIITDKKDNAQYAIYYKPPGGSDTSIVNYQNNNVIKFTVPNLNYGKLYMWIRGYENIYDDTYKFVILEGDWTNKPIPSYFDGIKSFGQQEDKISILSSSRNLIDDSIKSNTEIEYETGVEKTSPLIVVTGFTPFFVNTKRLYAQVTINGVKATPTFRWYDENKKYINGNAIDNIPTNARYVRMRALNSTPTNPNDCEFLLIDNADKNLSYEPYKCDKKDILLQDLGFDEGLRGLNNSVYDELNDIKNMAIKKIEKKIINNNDNIIFEGNLNSLYKYYLTIQNLKPSSIISDYPVATNHNDWINATKKCILVSDRISSKSNRVYIVSDLQLEEFKASLNLNPISIYYELAEPIETPLSENINLKTFGEKTYVSFENSISGTSSFKAPVDTTATITRLNRENRALEEENKTLRQDFESTTLSLTDSDLELVKQNVDIDFRLMEVEFALDIPQSTLSSNINFKKKGEVKSMARTPYAMMKIVILSGDYDREDYVHKVRKYYERGRMTKEEHDELMSLMTADEVISKKN